MACVDRLREDLMRSLGFEVEASAAARRCSGERVVEAPRRGGGKARRHLNQDKVAVQIGVPDPQVLRRRKGQQEYGSELYSDSRMTDTRARPHSAKLFRAPSRNRGRPTSASSARCPVGSSNVNGGCGANKDMEVLLEICRDQGRTGSLNPAGFDSSISAIANLPVEQFMGAAKEGWGPYFRNLHNKMRKEATAHSTATRMNRPPPDRRRKPGQAPSPLPRRAPPGAMRSSSQPTAYRQHNKAIDNSRQVVRNATIDRHSNRSDSLTRRRRRQREDGNNFDGLAASRARAAKREVEEETIGNMAMRLQALWEELKIPSPDRAYVTATYLEAGGRGGGRGSDGSRGAQGNTASGGSGTTTPTSADVHHELVRQIRLLLEHRAATIQVLRAVNLRESRLAEVEQALQAFQWHRGLDTDAIGAVSALAGLHDASLEVVRAVVEWRRNLWQPRAFCWQGVNYLEKMSQDTGFLRSPVGISFLASVGLEAGDMTFVLFLVADSGGRSLAADGEDDAGREGLDAEGKVGINIIKPPPAIVRLTPKAELVSEYRARFFKSPANTVEAGQDGEKRGGREGREGGWLQMATSPGAVVPATAEADIESVIVQEAALQRRVEAERVHLATKGCFVPLLRWLPGDNRNASQNGKRRQPLPSPPPVPPLSAKVSAAPTPAPQTVGRTGEMSVVSSGVDAVSGCPDAAAQSDAALPASGAFLPQSRQQQQQQQQHAPPLAASKMQGSTSSHTQQERSAAPRESGVPGGGHDEWDNDEEHEEWEEHGTNLQSGEGEPSQTKQLHLDAVDRTSSEGNPLQRDSFQYTDNGFQQQLQPLGVEERGTSEAEVEEGCTSEAETTRGTPDAVSAEGKVGWLKLTAKDKPEDGEGSSRADVCGVQATTCHSGRRQQEEENCDGCDERSIAPSACYDDDFEDDPKEYSDLEGDCLSDRAGSAGKQGGSRSHPQDDVVAHEEKTNAAYSGGKGLEVTLVTNTHGLEKRQRQQQLLEERESALATAARRIQKSARAWLRRRRRVREEQASLKEKCALQQQEEDTNTMKEKQEWLISWRAKRHPQVRQTQMQQQGPDVFKEGEDAAATRIQTAVRGHIASDQVNELRRRSNARRLAAAAKIQSFVRSRRRPNASKTSQRCLVEGSDHQQVVGLSRDVTAVDSTNPDGQEGERALLPVPADLGSGEAAARKSRSALTIQKAVRRAARRSRLSSEHRSGGVGDSPLTETTKLRAGGGVTKLDTALPQQRGYDSAATLSQQRALSSRSSSSSVGSADDSLYSPSSSASSPSSGSESTDVSFSDDSSSGDRQRDDEIGRQGRMSGGGGGGEGNGDVARKRRDIEDPSYMEAGQTPTSSPLKDLGEKSSPVTADKDESKSELRKSGERRSVGQDHPHSPPTPNPGGDEMDDISSNAMPMDTETSMDAMMTSVVGAASLGSSVVGLSPVPERQVLVAVASASEYGSEDLNFDALSSSPGSSSSSVSGRRGSERCANTAPVVAATTPPTSTTGGPSAVVISAEKKPKAENNRKVKGLGTVAAANQAGLVGVGGGSDDSSLMSLSVSSGG